MLDDKFLVGLIKRIFQLLIAVERRGLGVSRVE